MAIAAIVTASIAITATGTDPRGRGTVRGSRTGAPDAVAPSDSRPGSFSRAAVAGKTGTFSPSAVHAQPRSTGWRLSPA